MNAHPAHTLLSGVLNTLCCRPAIDASRPCAIPVGVSNRTCVSSRPPRYVGNYYYTLNNKLALKAAGGATGFPVTIGFMQLLIGSVYALFLWLAPDCRPLPEVSMDDVMKVPPL